MVCIALYLIKLYFKLDKKEKSFPLRKSFIFNYMNKMLLYFKSINAILFGVKIKSLCFRNRKTF